MTAIDWAKVMTGSDDEAFAYADWLEERGEELDTLPPLARQFPALAEAIRWDLEHCPFVINYVELRLPPHGSDKEPAFRGFSGNVSSGLWEKHPACALVVLAAVYGSRSSGYPALTWLEQACGLRFTTLFTASSDKGDGYRIRMKVTK